MCIRDRSFIIVASIGAIGTIGASGIGAIQQKQLAKGESNEANDLSNKIEFVSPSHKEMGLLINSLDIIVMPSISTDSWIEQYGRIAVESLACGKPVIASNCGSLPFILNKYGQIFNEGSVPQLTELLNGTVEIIDNFSSEEAIRHTARCLVDEIGQP